MLESDLNRLRVRSASARLGVRRIQSGKQVSLPARERRSKAVYEGEFRKTATDSRIPGFPDRKRPAIMPGLSESFLARLRIPGRVD